MSSTYLKKAFIVDDEINATRYLEALLKEYEDIDVVKAFSDSAQALTYLIKDPCDVLFLDIDMPNMNGIYIAELMSSLHEDMKICFVTAFNDYAVKAFEINAIDYILKPYTKERIEHCINKLRSLKWQKDSITEISNSYEYDLDIICGNDQENIILIQYDEIFYMEAIAGGVFIHVQDKVYQGNKPLNFYEEKLKKRSFFRTHKCYLVNLSKVKLFRPRINYTYDMFFKEINDVVPVSRYKVKELKTFFNH